MKTRITHWKATDGRYLGYLNDFPEQWPRAKICLT
jgi:hypothetical protein